MALILTLRIKLLNEDDSSVLNILQWNPENSGKGKLYLGNRMCFDVDIKQIIVLQIF